MTAPLVAYLSGWENYNGLLVKMIAPLGEDDLELNPGRGMWSVRMLASHIVAVRGWWFGEWMGERSASFPDMSLFDEGDEVERRPASAIADALQRSWSVVGDCISRWTEADLDAEFQRPERNAKQGRPWRTRRYIVWHVAEHDIHHGGEISLLLGMNGRTGIDV